MNTDGTLEVVSNNPGLTPDFAAAHGIARVHGVEGSPLDVLDRLEALLQSGYRLVSAPLPPNIPLMRAPYRSLIVEKNSRKYDSEGLKAVAGARERFVLQRGIGNGCMPGTEQDFSLIDRELLLRTLRDHGLGKMLDDKTDACIDAAFDSGEISTRKFSNNHE